MACLRILCSDQFSFFCILQTLLAWCAHLVCLHMHMQMIYRFTAIFLLGRNTSHCNVLGLAQILLVDGWMCSNQLKLNPSKTELMWLHSSRRNPGFIQNDIELYGNFITPVRVVRNLGVILDENMSMLDNISSVCQRCYYQL